MAARGIPAPDFPVAMKMLLPVDAPLFPVALDDLEAALRWLKTLAPPSLLAPIMSCKMCVEMLGAFGPSCSSPLPLWYGFPLTHKMSTRYLRGGRI